MKLTGLRCTYLSFIYLLLYFPIIVLIIYSFNASQYSLLWQGFSLHWFELLLHDTEIWRVTMHSVILGVLSSFFATILASIAAVSLYRYRFTGRKVMHAAIFIMILIPDIVIGISLLMLFSSLKLKLGFMSLLIAHVCFCMPFAMVTIYSNLQKIEATIFEAAKDLGASDSQLFFKILLPLIIPGIIVALLLCFTLSFDDVIISYFVSGAQYQILPLKLYAMVKTGVKPEINALCTAIFTLTFIVVLISSFFSAKNEN